MEERSSYEKLAHVCQTIRFHVTEDGGLNIPRHEKPQILLSSFVFGSFKFPFSDVVPPIE
jgi:hypothetical protein